MTTRDLVLSLLSSDFLAVWLVLLAGIVGMGLAIPFVKRSKQPRYVGGLDVCERIEKIQKEYARSDGLRQGNGVAAAWTPERRSNQ